MAYDEKYRKRTLEYWHEGHTLAQTKEVFRVYAKANPETYLHEIAVIFNCSSTAIRKCLKKLKITRKKDNTLQ